jgi:predicted deacylase
VPAANLPAVVAGQRTSPEDGKNMNRTFPGDPLSTPTSQISHYIDSVLFPMADLYLDLHSGGSSLDLVPSAIMQFDPDDAEHRARTIALFKALNAPSTVVMDTLGEARTSSAAAIRHGLVVVGTELGCRGAVTRPGLRLAQRVVDNALRYLGVMERPRDSDERPGEARFTAIAGSDAYVYAPANGVWEAYHELGDQVAAGEPAGCIHFLDDPRRPPAEADYKRSGTLFCRRAPGRSIRGNCVAIVVEDYPV